MDISQLARRRADCVARLEDLSAMGPGGDAEESREMAIAVSRATADYESAEKAFAKATSTLTVAEMAKLGVLA